MLDSIKHCQKEKDLELYVCCLMTSHVHLIIDLSGNALSNVMSVLKRRTSEELHKAITNNKTESRKEWMVSMMDQAVKFSTHIKLKKLLLQKELTLKINL